MRNSTEVGSGRGIGCEGVIPKTWQLGVEEARTWRDMEKSSIPKALDVDNWENGGNVNRR